MESQHGQILRDRQADGLRHLTNAQTEVIVAAPDAGGKLETSQDVGDPLRAAAFQGCPASEGAVVRIIDTEDMVTRRENALLRSNLLEVAGALSQNLGLLEAKLEVRQGRGLPPDRVIDRYLHHFVSIEGHDGPIRELGSGEDYGSFFGALPQHRRLGSRHFDPRGISRPAGDGGCG